MPKKEEGNLHESKANGSNGGVKRNNTVKTNFRYSGSKLEPILEETAREKEEYFGSAPKALQNIVPDASKSGIAKQSMFKPGGIHHSEAREFWRSELKA